MSELQTSKVTTDHLQRGAYLYVRQSTLKQVAENCESTKRQYQLRRRAVALGWQEQQIVTIDTDLGQSGASATERQGFQKLVAEVSLGRAGIVLGLEVSRLARNSSDWHRLLELCAHTRTLILDEDGVYDPMTFNDRLLLGLKGTMSEAELHVLRSRLRGGILNKARRGEFRTGLPIGLVYDSRGQVILDPDEQVQQSLRLLFETFFRLGSATAVVRYFRDRKLRFPRRVLGGPQHGALVWGRLEPRRTVSMLHNPRYAGAYSYGRRRHHTLPDGSTKVRSLDRDKWLALFQDAHPGYITWEQFEQIQKTIQETAQSHGGDRRRSPPREGPALLQGRALCGKCGGRMFVNYHRSKSAIHGAYVCRPDGPTLTEGPCQSMSAKKIDAAVSDLILRSLEPAAAQIAIAVHEELRRRVDEVEEHYRKHVERAQYQVELARARFMEVDPANRLVAGALEAEWNDRLRELESAQQEYEKNTASERRALDRRTRERMEQVMPELKALWSDPRTSAKDRKRTLRYLIEDVTLTRGETILVQVRFRGGATRSLEVEAPKKVWLQRTTSPEVVQLVDQLCNELDDAQVAQELNRREINSGTGQPYNTYMVYWLRRRFKLKSLKQRLADLGMVNTPTLCKLLQVNRCTVREWRKGGLLKGRTCNAKGEWMYDVSCLESLRAQKGKRQSAADESSCTTQR